MSSNFSDDRSPHGFPIAARKQSSTWRDVRGSAIVLCGGIEQARSTHTVQYGAGAERGSDDDEKVDMCPAHAPYLCNRTMIRKLDKGLFKKIGNTTTTAPITTFQMERVK
ncbi:hypothetical protein J6590_032840 [Homalodisca vitripennis]|nr:hypothetical protein J6590_032840 [Homalodisca vitripennis]